MIKELQVRNFALVGDLDISFEKGCHILTGETGAGKSIILYSLRLLMGDKLSKYIIGDLQKYSSVSALFDLLNYQKAFQKVKSLLEANGLEWTDGCELVIKRFIGSKSKVYINNDLVSLKLLKELSYFLIHYFVPGEQLSLLDFKQQQAYLDSYAEVDGLKKELAIAYDGYKQKEKELEEMQNFSLNEEERQLYEFQFRELEKSDLQIGEDEQVQKEFSKAYAAQELLEQCGKSKTLLNEGDYSIFVLLAELKKALSLISSKDEEGKRLLDLCEQAFGLLQELDTELYNYQSSVGVDEQKIQQLKNRMEEIFELKRKYGPSYDEVLNYRKKIYLKLQNYKGKEEQLELIKQDLEKTRLVYVKLAKELSQRREKAGVKFTQEIKKQLLDLELKDSQFEVQLMPCIPNREGNENVIFFFSANKGQIPKELKLVASSGEISRLMLAIKTLLVFKEEIPVVVFDEIDANIGGETVNKIAKKFHFLAQKLQLLCITHSPQIAASADLHYKVSKSECKGVVRTIIQKLDTKNREEELARMLGGKELSSVVSQHTKELIKNIKSL